MKRVGLVTSFRELNYGAELQAYALQSIINSLGYECDIVWIKTFLSKHRDIRIRKVIMMLLKMLRHPSIIASTFNIYGKSFSEEYTDGSKRYFEEFVQNNLKVEYYTYSELKKSAKKYYKYVCGSDQIWNANAVYVDPLYYLQFAPREKRVAYAPSFGGDYVPDYNKKAIKKFLEGFDTISVREEAGKRICAELINKDVQVVLDPTLLLDKEQWIERFDLSKSEDEYILVYFLNKPNPILIDILNIINPNKIKVIEIPYKHGLDEDFINVDAGPIEFLNLVYNAKYVITDSFHGTVFSIIFNKQFYTVKRDYGMKQEQSERLKSLLGMLNLKGHYITDKFEIDEIDYSGVNEIMNNERNKSLDYLRTELLR